MNDADRSFDDEATDDVAPEPPTQEQPERDDLLDPEDIDPEPVEGDTMDVETGRIPGDEELPESQGMNALDAEHLTEDATPRRRLSDEEREDF